MECKTLVEKISAKITTWSSRHISYAGRVVLINTILFDMFNFWAQVFIFPQEVVDQIIKLCRNFLGGGEEACYSKIAYVSWERVCSPKNKGGLRVKNLYLWNKACVAKLVWALAKKEDCMWIMWVHGRYIQGKEWADYTPKGDTSWYWKKLHQVKDLIKD